LFETALEVAIACRERFSDEIALRFIAQRHERVRARMSTLVGEEATREADNEIKRAPKANGDEKRDSA